MLRLCTIFWLLLLPAILQGQEQNRHVPINAGAEHSEVERLRFRGALGGEPRNHTDAARPEDVDLFAKPFDFRGIEDGDHGSLLGEQLRGSFSAFARTEHSNGFFGVRHIQRSFKVASPSRANITDTIQKRTMTVFSFQPLSSKWW